MKTLIRIILCATLSALAVTLAAFSLAGFRAVTPEQESLYMLRDTGGRVAVYGRERPETPVMVTGIETRTLREQDRALIAAGLPVGSREELAALLEDLGS